MTKTVVINALDLRENDVTEWGVIQYADKRTYIDLRETNPDVYFNIMIDGKWKSIRHPEDTEMVIERATA